ncbi:PREDICTED: kelch-like protein 35 [Condylura cristata]|uniref:kelch-like protein 35 n=1 Tax=Condylura cristata TaxID=143302 RepID=UPI000642C914|nr:PREDICTED: kelch-like protein 35 [Condylura cristata]
MLEGPTPEKPEPGSETPCAGSCHAQRVLQTLNAYRRSGTLTDVVLRAGGRDFPCHRAALSAGSAYFCSLVRLPLLAPAYFLEKVEADELLQACGDCRPLLLEARACFILGREAGALRARPRRYWACPHSRFMDQAEVIVVIGGCDRKGLLKLPFADAYHPESQRWTSLPSLPGYTRSEFAACAFRNDIYVSGGHIHSRDVWMFSSHLHTWIKVASLHKGRWRHKMAVVQGQLFAVGGFDGLRRLRSVERYDAFCNTWAAAAPLPEAVSSAAVVPCAGRLYVIGGARQDGVSTDKVQCFDPREDQWRLRSPAPFSQRCLEAVSIEDTIYVMGGLMSKIFSYKPGTDVWGEVAVLPSPVESCGVTVCDGKVHILGGRDEHGESTDRVFTFDPSSGLVEAQLALQRCTSSHGCVTIIQSLSR